MTDASGGMNNRHGADQSRIRRDRALPLRYVMPCTALVSVGLTWLVATSHHVSYQALNRLVILAITIGTLLLARRRWLWVIASLVTAGCLYVGAGLGGRIGITNIVIGAGIGSMTLVVTLDETRRIIAGADREVEARGSETVRPMTSSGIRRHWLLFVAVLVAGVGAAGCGRLPEAKPGQARVAVMSFNVVHDQPPEELPWSVRLPAIGRMLSDKEPDIIGFQETLAHQVEGLAELLDNYDWVGFGREDGNRSGESGPIFFRTDRFELNRNGVFWLSETPDTPSIGWDASTYRIVTWAELVPLDGGSPVTVFNTHFDHLGGTARAQSARLLVQRVNEYSPSGPVVVTGDLNAVALNSPLEPLLDELDDARTSAPVSDLIGSLNNWSTKYGVYNIDFILIREAEPARFETVNDGYGVEFLSDHFPIVAVLYLDE